MPELDQSTSADNEVATFNDALKISTRREVTIDVNVQYHGRPPAGPVDDEDFDRRVIDAIRRESDRSVLI
jgi:hypothetical protein